MSDLERYRDKDRRVQYLHDYVERTRERRKKYARQYYISNKERFRESGRISRDKKEVQMGDLVIDAKASGCLICEESDPCCIDLHHRDPSTKAFHIAAWRMVVPLDGREMLEREIEKCDPICANCHRKLHAGLIDNYVL